MSEVNVKKVKTSEIEFKERLVSVQRVTKVTKGGRTFHRGQQGSDHQLSRLHHERSALLLADPLLPRACRGAVLRSRAERDRPLRPPAQTAGAVQRLIVCNVITLIAPRQMPRGDFLYPAPTRCSILAPLCKGGSAKRWGIVKTRTNPMQHRRERIHAFRERHDETARIKPFPTVPPRNVQQDGKCKIKVRKCLERRGKIL